MVCAISWFNMLFIFRLTKNIVLSTKIKNIYVATDKDPMIKDLTKHLEKQKVFIEKTDIETTPAMSK